MPSIIGDSSEKSTVSFGNCTSSEIVDPSVVSNSSIDSKGSSILYVFSESSVVSSGINASSTIFVIPSGVRVSSKVSVTDSIFSVLFNVASCIVCSSATVSICDSSFLGSSASGFKIFLSKLSR